MEAELPGAASCAVIPGIEVVRMGRCPHGNLFCLACEDCGRLDQRNGGLEFEDLAV